MTSRPAGRRADDRRVGPIARGVDRLSRYALPMIALQAVTPEALADELPEVSLDEARRIVGADFRFRVMKGAPA